ncbi:MerR family DNA-binding protein [Streptomyces sp. NPDC002588]|uniref:MerR family DNA-binding protein n=1 Tax=Streptomyces sp. NPDC002588 TaxID=3154419 RepID=UPI00332D21D6
MYSPTSSLPGSACNRGRAQGQTGEYSRERPASVGRPADSPCRRRPFDGRRDGRRPASAARDAGFSVAETGRLLVARPSDTDLRARMAAKARNLHEQIDRLTRLRDSLRHAAVCTHEPVVDRPDFKRAVGNVPVGAHAPDTSAS